MRPASPVTKPDSAPVVARFNNPPAKPTGTAPIAAVVAAAAQPALLAVKPSTPFSFMSDVVFTLLAMAGSAMLAAPRARFNPTPTAPAPAASGKTAAVPAIAGNQAASPPTPRATDTGIDSSPTGAFSERNSAPHLRTPCAPAISPAAWAASPIVVLKPCLNAPPTPTGLGGW